MPDTTLHRVEDTWENVSCALRYIACNFYSQWVHSVNFFIFEARLEILSEEVPM